MLSPTDFFIFIVFVLILVNILTMIMTTITTNWAVFFGAAVAILLLMRTTWKS